MKIHPHIILSLALAAAWLIAPTGFSASPEWTNNGIVWGGTTNGSFYYRPGISTGTNGTYDDYPTNAAGTTPVWKTAGTGGTATLDATNNFLNITTSGTNVTLRYDMTNNWDASIAATVEIVLRINSVEAGFNHAGGILAGNGTEYYSAALGVDASGYLRIQSTSITGVMASDFNTIRMTLSGMQDPSTSEVRFYVNNSTNAALVITSLTASATGNKVSFGDLSASTGQSGSIDWRSVAWVNGQAIAPVPEPASVTLVLGGLGVLGWCLYRRRRN